MRNGLVFGLLLLAHPALAGGAPERTFVVEVPGLRSGISLEPERVDVPQVRLTGDPDSPMDSFRPLALFSNGFGRLRLEMSARAQVSISVFGVNGRRVGGRDLGLIEAGAHDLPDFGLGSAPAGVYFARVRVGGELLRAKVIRLR